MNFNLIIHPHFMSDSDLEGHTSSDFVRSDWTYDFVDFWWPWIILEPLFTGHVFWQLLVLSVFISESFIWGETVCVVNDLRSFGENNGYDSEMSVSVMIVLD